MVTKMKKFAFIAFHKDYHHFLHELRELGMIHVEEQDHALVNEEELRERFAQVKRLNEAKKRLLRLRDKKTAEPFNAADAERGKEIPEAIETIENRKSQFGQQLQVSVKEREALLPWGNFDPENIRKIEASGYHIHFLIVPDNRYNPEWESLYHAVIINRQASKTYLLTFSHHPHLAEELNVEEMKTPKVSIGEIDRLIASLKEKTKAKEAALKKLSNDLPSIDAALAVVNAEITFTKVARSATPAAEEKLLLLQGWAPEENVSEIAAYLNDKEAYYQISDPTPDDNVPIKFQNNRFMRLFEPIAELYMLPKYNEIDLTPYFAPFYMLFFGLSLGDIGYGLFLLLVATIAKVLKKNKPASSMKGVLSLVQVLGASTMVAGLLTGGFFGFNIYNLDIPPAKVLKAHIFFDNDKMFMLSLILGVIQILFGMCLKVANRIKQFGVVHALSSIGWLVLLVSFIISTLFKEAMPMFGILHLCILIPAAVLIYFFNAPGKNPLVNLGLGLWDTYNMVTGLLGDTLSYVRLFALGLSGSILASVFNSLATGMSPDKPIIGPLVTILIFLFGHAITIFMNALGAMVHPLRLTFVEFYKNAEFEGGGIKYTPFKNE